MSMGETVGGYFGVRTGTALYVGAVLGPGVLLLPALSVQVAGPASIVAWAVLLVMSVPLAAIFAALAVRYPHSPGPAGYVATAFGSAASAMTGWWFFAGRRRAYLARGRSHSGRWGSYHHCGPRRTETRGGFWL